MILCQRGRTEVKRKSGMERFCQCSEFNWEKIAEKNMNNCMKIDRIIINYERPIEMRELDCHKVLVLPTGNRNYN